MPQVLVVEDNEINMKVCVAMLRKLGVGVTQAWHGLDAVVCWVSCQPVLILGARCLYLHLCTQCRQPFSRFDLKQEKCNDQVFDLILLDLQMPICSGFEATRMLRARHGPNQKTPIVALTGMTGEIGT